MSVDGIWNVAVKTPMGMQRGVLELRVEADQVTGRMTNPLGEMPIENIRIEGDRLFFTMKMTRPVRMTFEHEVVVEGDRMTGQVKAGFLGSAAFTAERAPE